MHPGVVARSCSQVSCPIPGRRARSHADQPARPDDELNYLLGVAIVGSLPPTETDQESLQKFGDSVRGTVRRYGSRSTATRYQAFRLAGVFGTWP